MEKVDLIIFLMVLISLKVTLILVTLRDILKALRKGNRMRRRFGWGLPPGVSNRMIEEQAGAFEEEGMGEEKDRLVDEIASIVRGETSYSSRNERASISMAKVLIARIGKAYADGELELPGEKGRWKWPTLEEPNEGIDRWTGQMLRTGDEVFIALSGTGKEEDMPKELSDEITKGQRP